MKEPAGGQPYRSLRQGARGDVFWGSGIEAFGVLGAADRVVANVVNVTGPPLVRAPRVELELSSQNLWELQLRALRQSEVRGGDVLLASF